MAMAGVLAVAAWSAARAQEGAGDVVYVPTPQIVVETMLKMAKVGPSDYLIDLGSGDGRIVITAAKKYGARGFGVDLDRVLLKLANESAKREGVADRAQFFERNLFETDLSKATVITSYLLPEMNERLRPKLLRLKPGTRVVAHDYHMGDWQPDDNDTLSVPEKTVGQPGVSYVYLWYVPVNAAGKWQARVPVGGQTLALDLDLSQRYQLLSGAARVNDKSAQVQGARVRGEDVTGSRSVAGRARFGTRSPAGSRAIRSKARCACTPARTSSRRLSPRSAPRPASSTSAPE
jgi:methylase of polypeptide subunit release factors